MPTRRDCLSAAAALGAASALGALAPALAASAVPAAPGAASGAAPARTWLVGGWVLTGDDLARLGPGFPGAQAAAAVPLA